MRAIGYARVSTDEQVKSGAGLAAQVAAIRAEADRRDWEVLDVVEDAGYSAKDLKRPGIASALTRLDHGEADALVVSKLDRLSRSVLDFATLMEHSKKKGWGLVALDIGVDTTTPSGEVMANVMAAFSQFERRLIGQRTREALLKKKEDGVVLGRPRLISEDVRQLIYRYRSEGMTLKALGDRLHEDDIVPPGRGRWQPSTLHRVLSQTPGTGIR
jgi:DNA invertase Pin-like site-specific DNA recombinase